MSKIYASKLTKEDLQASGITEITKDARVFKGEREVFPRWIPGKRPYLGFILYCYDENGHLIKGKDRVFKYKRKDGTIGEYISWWAKQRTIGLHRIMWAWHYGEVPEGMVVDHINNKHETLDDYRLENLQLLSPRDNLAKERAALSNRELKCKMTLPLSHYEDKLNAFVNKYNSTKDQEEKHSLRVQISNYRAKIRYWKNHEAEYVKNEEERIKNEETKAIEAKALKARKERTKDLKQYQKIVDEARALYKKDPSLENSYYWHLAVNNYNEYVKTHPFKTQKQLFVELDSDNQRN